MKQIPFEWHAQSAPEELDAVVLETKTTEAAIVLMASVLIAVVRGATQAEEVADER